MAISWSDREAFALSINQFLPVEVPIGSQYAPSDKSVEIKIWLWESLPVNFLDACLCFRPLLAACWLDSSASGCRSFDRIAAPKTIVVHFFNSIAIGGSVEEVLEDVVLHPIPNPPSASSSGLILLITSPLMSLG